MTRDPGDENVARIGGIPLAEAERIALALSMRDRLAVSAWVFEQLRENWRQEGTYRALLDQLAFEATADIDPYRVLLAAGAMDINNGLRDDGAPGRPRRPQMSATPYQQLPGLADYYLEDSYVLGIHLTGEALEFDIDIVLTDRHPEYRPPRADEQYCYRNGRLEFPDPRVVALVATDPIRPSTDATGQRDFGSIDGLEFEAGRYRVTGVWGVIEVESGPPVVALAQGDVGVR
jgi:hypothetical protein